MRKSEVALLVSAISLLVSIVSLFVGLNASRAAIGILIFVVLAVVAGAAWAWHWHMKQDLFYLIDHQKSLFFEDREAHVARQISQQRIRANHKGHERFNAGRLRGDGRIDNIYLDGDPIYLDGEIIREENFQQSSGEIQINKLFRPPLKTFEAKDLELQFDWIDNYSKDTESWRHPIARKTKKLTLKIEFHPDKIPSQVRAGVAARTQGQVDDWSISQQLVFSQNRRVVELVEKKPKWSEYILEWDW